MLNLIKTQSYKRGSIFAFETKDKYLIETYHTTYKREFGIDRVIELSTWSGCPCRCRFCMTSKLAKIRPLKAEEIIEQIRYVVESTDSGFTCKNVRRINYTRMGEPFLNINEVKKSLDYLRKNMPNTKHYISTIGIKNADFSFIDNSMAIQLSIHTLDEIQRNRLMPYKRKMAIKELGQIRTPSSYQKITLNFIAMFWKANHILLLKKYFDPEYFFVKFTPLNNNQKIKEIQNEFSTSRAG